MSCIVHLQKIFLSPFVLTVGSCSKHVRSSVRSSAPNITAHGGRLLQWKTQNTRRKPLSQSDPLPFPNGEKQTIPIRQRMEELSRALLNFPTVRICGASLPDTPRLKHLEVDQHKSVTLKAASVWN